MDMNSFLIACNLPEEVALFPGKDWGLLSLIFFYVWLIENVFRICLRQKALGGHWWLS